MGGQSLGANMDLWGFFCFLLLLFFPPHLQLIGLIYFQGLLLEFNLLKLKAGQGKTERGCFIT